MALRDKRYLFTYRADNMRNVSFLTFGIYYYYYYYYYYYNYLTHSLNNNKVQQVPFGTTIDCENQIQIYLNMVRSQIFQ
jgi:hypothetical protein